MDLIQAHNTATSSEELDKQDDLIENDKAFTVNDIQALMDNQLLHKSQLDQNLENNKLEQQQHLILVTQNGDKIILIQNPTVNDNQLHIQNNLNATNSNDHLPSHTNRIIEPVLSNDNQENNFNSNLNSTINSNKLINHPESDSNLNNQTSNEHVVEGKEDDDESRPVEEVNRIQMQHKIRQQSLMLHFERLKEKFKLNNRQEVDDSEQQASSSLNEDDHFWEFSADEPNKYEMQRSNYKPKTNVKRKSVPIEQFYCEAKWYPSFCNNLEKAHNHLKRRSENIDQLSKYFPTASYTFDSRCTELRNLLNKLELNLERFQNVMGRDLHFIEEKLKTFFQDYHLEQFESEIEEQDRKDLEQNSDIHNNYYHNSINHNNQSSLGLKNKMVQSLSKMELITPSSISITPTDREIDEIDPVPEIRDIQNDISLEEMGSKWYSNNINLNKSFQPVFINIRTKKSTRKSDNEFKSNKHLKKS